MNPVKEKLRHLMRTPSDINEHLLTLRNYAFAVDHVTEFGVRSIVSTWALLDGGPIWLRSYDIQHPDQCGGNLPEVETAAAVVGVDFQFVQADVLAIPPVETDFLFIDTLHTYDQLSKELSRHAPGVSLFIAMHDVTKFGRDGELPGTVGLLPAVNNFLIGAEGQNWKVRELRKNNNGLLVLQRDDRL